MLESLHIVALLFDYSLIFTYIFQSSLSFALVLHLYLLEHGGGFFIETIVLSCFTYIILRVLQNSMVICFKQEINPNMLGIQD